MLATLAVSVSVIVILVVFERWIPMIPGGLVAVVGSIGVSWRFDLAVAWRLDARIGPERPAALGLPSGIGWGEIVPLLATCVSMFLVILAQSAATSRAYAVKYKEHFVENTDLVGLGAANLAAGLSGTFVVNGSPTKTKMAEEAKADQPDRHARHGGAVAIVLLFLTKPLQYMPDAVLSAVVFVIGIKLVDVANMRSIYRLASRRVLDRRPHRRRRRRGGRRAGYHPRDRALGAPAREAPLRPPDAVVVPRRQGHPILSPPTPGTVSEPGLVVYRFSVGLFYANAARFSEEILALVDTDEPPRWLILLADGIDDIDYTGGQTVLETANQLGQRSIAFGIADRRFKSAMSSTGSASPTRSARTATTHPSGMPSPPTVPPPRCTRSSDPSSVNRTCSRPRPPLSPPRSPADEASVVAAASEHGNGLVDGRRPAVDQVRREPSTLGLARREPTPPRPNGLRKAESADRCASTVLLQCGARQAGTPGYGPGVQWHESPAQRHFVGPRGTGCQALITRRSQVQILPPPPFESPGHRPGLSSFLGGRPPATSTGSDDGDPLTWGFASGGPVDVYRFAVAIMVANRSAAAALMPRSRCW